MSEQEQQVTLKELAAGTTRRLRKVQQRLSRDQLGVGLSALALALSLFFPWYDKHYAIAGDKTAAKLTDHLSAWSVFSFIEAAILLLALGVVALIFMRAERTPLRLPLSDGRISQLAGGWAVVLILFRMFDRPSPANGEIGATFGVLWGIFFALFAAAGILYFGTRLQNISQQRALPPGPIKVDSEPVE